MKKIVNYFTLPLLLLFGSDAAQVAEKKLGRAIRNSRKDGRGKRKQRN